MSRVRMCQVAGVSLLMLLAGTKALEAQTAKPPAKTRAGVPGTVPSQPTTGGQRTGSQVNTSTVELAEGMLLPCCVVQGFESSSELKGGTFLVVKDTKTGAMHRLKMAGKVGSSSSSAKFRPGQTVDMNMKKTLVAITPFPVEDEKRSQINGNSAWVMRTSITVSNNGRVDGKTKIKSAEALRGFTGGVEVLLTDRSGNILHQTNLRTYGVNANSERTKNWSETVSADVINKTRRVAIKHSYEPKNRFAASLGWIRDNADDISTVMQCVAKYSGDQEEEKPAPGGGGISSSHGSGASLEPTHLECVEAAEELAEELGF